MSDTIESAELQHVAVDGDVDLRTVVTGAEDGAACTFEVHKVDDDSVVATIQGEVQEGVAVGSWDPQLTPDGDERGLRVYYTVTVDDQTTRSQELEVYLDWVEISSVDEEDQPLADVPYKLRIGELLREGSTGSAATYREAGLPPGELDFEWCGPYQLVEWVDDQGPKRKAKLKKVHRLRFLWPDPERGGGRRLWFEDGTELELQERFHAHTQWVNLPVDPGAPERGSRVTLRVVGDQREAVKAGDKAFVKVVWPPADQRSKRTEPARELVGGAAKPWTQGDDEKGLELTFGADGGEVSFELELGRAGGDQVTVHVGCTDRCEDAKLVITNRRKVWYQTTRMAHQALVDLHEGEATARAWLDAVAVELEAEEDVVWDDAPALDGPAKERGLARVPAAWFEAGAAGERAIVGSHNWEWFKKKFLRRNGALGVHLVVADAIVWGTQWDGSTAFSQAFSIEWPPEVDADTGQPTLERFVFLPNRERFEVFPQALHDGGLTLRGATWSTPNRRSVPRRFRNRSGPIDPAWVRVDRHAGRDVDEGGGGAVRSDGVKGAWITFPPESEPGQVLAAGVTLRVRGRLHPGQVGRAGSTQGFQIVTTAVPDPGLASFIIAHELGHNMRQSPVRDTGATAAENRRFYLPPGLEFADHPHGYRGKGHQGPHCNFGLNDAGATHIRNVKPDGSEEFLPINGAAADQDDYPRLRKQEGGEYVRVGGLCLMYGGARPKIAEETVGFCEHCAPYARANALDDMHLDWDVAAFGDDEDGDVEAEAEEADPPEPLRIRLLDAAYRPHANAAYELTLPDGSKASGTTDADGVLEQPLPAAGPGGGDVRVKYTPQGEDEREVTVRLPGDDPDGDDAALAHLHNVGFGAPGQPLEATVRQFQAARGLPLTGALDEATKDAIDALFSDEQADALRRGLRGEG